MNGAREAYERHRAGRALPAWRELGPAYREAFEVVTREVVEYEIAQALTETERLAITALDRRCADLDADPSWKTSQRRRPEK